MASSASAEISYRMAKNAAVNTLSQAGIEEAENDAFLLMSECCAMDRTRFLMEADQRMPFQELNRYRDMVSRRARRIPLQHITGRAFFMGYPFKVTKDTLIPRPETELLAMEAVRILKKLQKTRSHPRVLDLCTGSGILAVSIAKECPFADVSACDLSEAALETARENARTLGVQAAFRQGDLFEPVTGPFDVIVSNPPYIPTAVIGTLDTEVREFDPRMALDGGEDGLSFYRRIAKEANAYLTDSGVLLLEIGYDQADAVGKILSKEGFASVRVMQDLSGSDRVVCASCR